MFIGRCADYVLRRQPGMLSVFIHAPLEQRVLRIAKLRNIDEDKARALYPARQTKRAPTTTTIMQTATGAGQTGMTLR